MRTGPALIFAVAIFQASFSRAAELDLTYWIDAAQDSTGVVWGICQENEDRPRFFDGDRWHVLDNRRDIIPESSKPVSVTRAPNGFVVILWKQGEGNSYCLTEHRGRESRRRGQFSADLFFSPSVYRPLIMVDSRDDVWITHNGPDILRLQKDGKLEQLGLEGVKSPSTTLNGGMEFSIVRALEDEKGQVWFWADSRGENRRSPIGGLLVFDGTALSALTVTGRGCSSLVREDAGHVLAAFRDVGLYRIDVSSRQAVALPEPKRHDYESTSQLICHDDAIHVLNECWACGARKWENATVLWTLQRTKNEKEPRCLVIDRAPPCEAALRQLNGMLFGIAGGLVFVPDDGKNVQRFDWRSGLALAQIDRIFPLVRNRLLAISLVDRSNHGGGSAIVPAPPWPLPKPNDRVQLFETKDSYVADRRGHIWTIDLEKKELQEWDGTKWAGYALPESPDSDNALAMGDEMLWISVAGAPLLFDPTTKQFQKFSRLDEQLTGRPISRRTPGTFAGRTRPQSRVPPSIARCAGMFDTIVSDSTGVFWFTRNHRLYRGRGELCVPVFSENEPNPFLDGRHLSDVLLDPKGNAFLRTEAWRDCVFLTAKRPAPHTKLRITVKRDELHAKLSATGEGRHWYSWRLDDGEWTEPSEQTDIKCEFLPNGQHNFSARALDENLQMDSQGATASFEVNVDRKIQIREAIRSLSANDLVEREKAVRTLVRHPQLALPALKQARGSATTDAAWWIDAALQEIERKASPPSAGK